MSVSQIILSIIGVLALVALNGFFVAAEFAIVKVRSTQIESLVKSGSGRARLAQHIVNHMNSYLSATQLGITMTSLGLGWVGEPFVADIIAPLFAMLGWVTPALTHTVAFILAFTIITYLHIVLGELAPKWLAIQHAKETALAFAAPLDVFFKIFRPFIWVLNASAKTILRLIGKRFAGGEEIGHSEEELRMLLSEGKAITTTGKSISLRAIELRDRTVRQVMVPRTNVVVLDTNKTIEQNLALAVDSQFTRYPLCDQNMDNVVGMVHLKDLIKLKGETGPGTRLLEIKREMPFVPETMSLERILNTFLTKRVLMAVAVDEYGGTSGLVTLEDLLEEIVGEIRDEYDTEEPLFRRIDAQTLRADARIDLEELSELLGIRLPEGEYKTLGGLIFELSGRVPKEGESFRLANLEFTVEKILRRRILTVRIVKKVE